MKITIPYLVATILDSTNRAYFHNHKKFYWMALLYTKTVAIFSSIAKPLFLPSWSLEKLLEDNRSYQYSCWEI